MTSAWNPAMAIGELTALSEEIMSSIDRALDELHSDTKRKNSAVGRGGFRKRKQTSQFRTVISESMDDEYRWRKYGQKVIFGCKFPRSYFVCTHKFDQGCRALKHVQKSEDDPSLFMITYMGEHSCTNLNIIPDLIIHSNSSEPSFSSFGSNTSNITQKFPLPLLPVCSKTQDRDEEVLSNLTPDSFDLAKLYEGSMLKPLINESSSEHGDDQSSGLHSSSGSVDMSFMMDSVSFDDDMFAFNDGELVRD